MENLIKHAESTGQYKFPYKAGFSRNVIINESLIFEDFISFPENWFSINNYHYTITDMQDHWNCIKTQRLCFKAALMVADGKIKGINEGLRMFNIF